MNDLVAKSLEGFAPMTEAQASKYNKQGTSNALLSANIKQFTAEAELAKLHLEKALAFRSALYREIQALNTELGITGSSEEVKEFEGRLYYKRSVPEKGKLELLSNEAK